MTDFRKYFTTYENQDTYYKGYQSDEQSLVDILNSDNSFLESFQASPVQGFESTINPDKQERIYLDDRKEMKFDFLNLNTPKELFENIIISRAKGNKQFESAMNNASQTNSDLNNYRQYLTKIAKIESNFNSRAKNKKLPAYGYFQMLEGHNGVNNITNYAKTSINEFINNPELQIQSAYKLTKENEKALLKDFAEAARKGISKDELLAIAHFSGVGGARKFIRGNNLNDGSSSQSDYLRKFRNIT